MLEKMQSEKIIISSLKHTQKAFLMKYLLVSAWASYQHLPIKLSQALLCGSIFWFFTERQGEASLALSFPSLPRPGTGFWIGTNGIRLFGPVKSSTSLPPHSFFHCFFLNVALLPNKCTFKNNMSHVEPLTNTPLTCPLSHLWAFVSHLLVLAVSVWFTFSPRLPFCSLIFPGCKCALPNCPRCPLALSVPSIL